MDHSRCPIKQGHEFFDPIHMDSRTPDVASDTPRQLDSSPAGFQRFH